MSALKEKIEEINTHYERVCLNCGHTWLGLHCPHDGYQNNCSSCNIRPHTAVEPKDGCTCNGVLDFDDVEQLLKEEIKKARIDEIQRISIGSSHGIREEYKANRLAELNKGE